MPINFGAAFGPNPAEELASAVGGAVENAPAQAAQLQQVGMQVLQPYAKRLMADPYNTQLLAQFNRIAKMYHLPSYSAGSNGGSWDSSGGDTPQDQSAGGSTPQTPGAASPQSAPASAAGAPGTSSGAAVPAPKPGMSPSAVGWGHEQSSPSPNGASPQRWDDPRLQPRAQAYTQLLQQAATNPTMLRDQTFHAKLIRAAAQVGRGPNEVKGDIAAYQQKVKAGVQPGGGHPAAVTQGQPVPGTPPAAGAAATQPPAGPQPPASAQTPAEQPQGGTSSNPAPGPGETQQYMRPSSHGPLRFDTNAWLGPLSLQDFSTLSGMTPQERIAALRQQGRDTNAFDPKWLHSEPSLSPGEQVTIAHDAATAIGNDIRDGATPDQVKLSVATYRPYLTPAQNAELDSNIKDQLDGSLRIRQQQVSSTGFLRQQTLALMNRRLTDDEGKTAWDHDYRYTVLNDRNAQWSAQQSTRQQNANTAYGRLQEEITRDQANGLIDASGRPIKGGAGGIKPGELITTANKMLDSIRSGVNEYNQRLQTALATPGKAGVNPPMEADLQNQIDAYNNLVDMMGSRGMHYFKHYQGPDQSAISANTAAVTAANAVGAQGQTTTAPVKHSMPAGATPGKFSNGRTGYSYNHKLYYDDGTPVNP